MIFLFIRCLAFLFLLQSGVLLAAPGVSPILSAENRDVRAMVEADLFNENFQPLYRRENFIDGRGRGWLFQIISVEDAPRPVFFLPHDDESEAFQAAAHYLARHRRGTIVFLDCSDERNCWGRQPACVEEREAYRGMSGWNRFWHNGFHPDCRPVDPNNYCDRAYADKVFSYFENRSPVVTLHNNPRGCDRAGSGRGTVCARTSHPGTQAFYRGGSEDDVIIHHGPRQISGIRREFRSFLQAERINEIYEFGVEGGPRNCSFSYQASERGLFYFNVETEELRGHRVQLNILERAIAWARERFPD